MKSFTLCAGFSEQLPCLLIDMSQDKSSVCFTLYFHGHCDQIPVCDYFINKNDRKVIAIAIFEDRDLAIARSLILNKTESNSAQDREKLQKTF